MDAVINPYANVDWESVQHIVSFSHGHSRIKNNDGTKGTVYQQYLDNAVDGGARHIAFSNYYPSEPFYPLTDWFETVPSGILGCPNAEHHNFVDGWGALHMNGIGCTAITGKAGGLTPVGANMTAEGAIKYILSTLQYSDGGGITINHPGWSVAMNAANGFPKWLANNSSQRVLELLDIDDRVLGIEIQNSYEWVIMQTGIDYEEHSRQLWDEILMTGKRCWGFCVPDHETESSARWLGKNILLVDSFTEHDCLKAYRNGNFYSKIFDSGLAYNNISYNNNTFTASAPQATEIDVIIDGEKTTVNNNMASVSIPSTATFVRAEAKMPYRWTARNGETYNVTEIAYTNPIIFKNYQNKKARSNSYFDRIVYS